MKCIKMLNFYLLGLFKIWENLMHYGEFYAILSILYLKCSFLTAVFFKDFHVNQFT